MNAFKKLLALIAFVLVHRILFAQPPQIALVRANGTTLICTSTDTAYALAVNDDYIYLPAGNFSFPSINKRIHIFGVGHNPDSTLATARTIMNGLVLNTGADNGSIEGIFFQGRLPFTILVK